MIRLTVAALAVLAAAGLAVAPAEARPSYSWGQKNLSVDMSSCPQHAQAAYINAGWSDISAESGWAKAHKDHYTSATVCNAGTGGVFVTIFVAYDGGDDPNGDLSEAERMRLQNAIQ